MTSINDNPHENYIGIIKHSINITINTRKSNINFKLDDGIIIGIWSINLFIFPIF